MWGKFFGGVTGFAFGGPLGALFGAAAGHAFDKLRENPDDHDLPPAGSAHASGRNAKEAAFSIAVIVLGAKMAKVDGVVTRAEIDAFKQVFRIPPSETRNVARIFDAAKRDAQGFEPYARQMAILAAIFFREHLGPGQLAGLALAFAGVYLLAGESARPVSVVHLLCVVAAAFAWAVANIVIKRLGRIDAFALNGWVALLAAPQLLLASLVLETGQEQAIAGAHWQAFAAVGYMAVCSSIVAYGLWYHLIGRYPVNRVVPLTLLSPVMAVFFAVLLLDEPLSTAVVLGGVLTLSGVALIEVLRPASVEAEPLP